MILKKTIDKIPCIKCKKNHKHLEFKIMEFTLLKNLLYWKIPKTPKVIFTGAKWKDLQG